MEWDVDELAEMLGRIVVQHLLTRMFPSRQVKRLERRVEAIEVDASARVTRQDEEKKAA